MLKGILFAVYIFCFNSIFGDILILSIPKSGSHLLYRAVELISNKSKFVHIDRYKQGQDVIYWAHWWSVKNDDLYSFGPSECKLEFLRKSDLKILIVYRDPREVVCSISRQTGFAVEQIISNIDCFYDFYLTPFIKRDYIHSRCFHGIYNDLFGWKAFKNVYFVKYEDLVGSRGGGCDQLQAKEIRLISSFLGVELSEESISEIATNLYGKVSKGTLNTFRNGQVNSWKSLFSSAQLEKFYCKEGSLIQDLGYEN